MKKEANLKRTQEKKIKKKKCVALESVVKSWVSKSVE